MATEVNWECCCIATVFGSMRTLFEFRMHAAVGCHLCGILVGTYLFKCRIDPVLGWNPASITPSIEFRIHPASVPNLKRCAFSLDPYLPSNANRLSIEYFFQCCHMADSTAKAVFLINAGSLLEHCRTNFTPLFGIVVANNQTFKPFSSPLFFSSFDRTVFHHTTPSFFAPIILLSLRS
jgi:hypothetical protein